jgi:hypothetical protein
MYRFLLSMSYSEKGGTVIVVRMGLAFKGVSELPEKFRNARRACVN